MARTIMACLRPSGVSTTPFLGSRSPGRACRRSAPVPRPSPPQSLPARGGLLLLGEGLFAPCLVLLAPSEQHALGQIVLATELGGAFLAGCDLPTALQFEFSGVVSLQSLLLDPDVTLHPIHGEVDFDSGPVEWVHPRESLRQLANLGIKGPKDLSRNIDKYLYEEDAGE